MKIHIFEIPDDEKSDTENIGDVNFFCLFDYQSELSTFFKLMCWVRHHPPVPIVS
jgi:hypothetical protein